MTRMTGMTRLDVLARYLPTLMTRVTIGVGVAVFWLTGLPADRAAAAEKPRVRAESTDRAHDAEGTHHAVAPTARAASTVTFDSVETLRMTLSTVGREDTSLPANVAGGGDTCGGSITASHVSGPIGPGEFPVQLGFAEDEIFAAQYDINPDLFPITIRQIDFLLAQINLVTVTTTTHYTVFVWDGPPDFNQGGFVVASFSSLDEPALLPVVIQPTGQGQATLVQITIDPEDALQIIVENLSGTNTFSVGVRIEVHNNPPANPCEPDLDTFITNAFPVVDNDGVASADGNWIFTLDCPGCSSGWHRFSEFDVDCTPSGDWLIQATYESPFAFTTGACCFGPENCENTVDCSLCQQGNGTFFEDMVCNDIPCAAPVGACCISGGCLTDVTQALCDATPGAVYAGNGSDCAADACVAGACCMADGSCEMLLPTECVAIVGDFHGAGVSCASANCPQPSGACCLFDSCFANQTQAGCEGASGTWQGMDSPCTPDPCGALILLSSDPPSGSIDARQPTELDGSGDYGWDEVTLSFSGNVASLLPDDFVIASTSGTAPVPVNVDGAGGLATLTFSGPIPVWAWTQITHTASGNSVCLGFLPGDTDADRTSAPADILHVIDCLNGVANPSCAPWQCDIDRSDECGPPDILRVIDLLNGATDFDVWLDASLPASPCLE